jgi:hypothetical protein
MMMLSSTTTLTMIDTRYARLSGVRSTGRIVAPLRCHQRHHEQRLLPC